MKQACQDEIVCNCCSIFGKGSDVGINLFLTNILALKPDIEDAEETLKSVKAGHALKAAINSRNLSELERSITHIRKSGYEKDWHPELTEGEKLVHRLKRLEKLRAEILELKQSTISEIRSYGNPPPAVHKVGAGYCSILIFGLLNCP